MALGLSDQPIPLALVSGKRFTTLFTVANSGITDPAEVTAVELQVRPATSIKAIADAERLIWTLATFEFDEPYLDGEVLCLPIDIGDDITGDMRPGLWSGLLSIGLDGAPPELPILNLTLSVTEEP